MANYKASSYSIVKDKADYLNNLPDSRYWPWSVKINYKGEATPHPPFTLFLGSLIAF